MTPLTICYALLSFKLESFTYNANFFKLVDDEVNIFSSKGEIFNIPVNLEWNKNLTNQNTVFKINTKTCQFFVLAQI